MARPIHIGGCRGTPQHHMRVACQEVVPMELEAASQFSGYGCQSPLTCMLECLKGTSSSTASKPGKVTIMPEDHLCQDVERVACRQPFGWLPSSCRERPMYLNPCWLIPGAAGIAQLPMARNSHANRFAQAAPTAELAIVAWHCLGAPGQRISSGMSCRLLKATRPAAKDGGGCSPHDLSGLKARLMHSMQSLAAFTAARACDCSPCEGIAG